MLNCFNFCGRLTGEPILRHSPTKTDKTGEPKVYCTIIVAINMNYWQNKYRSVTFFEMSAFGRLAKYICGYLHKGDIVCGSGTIVGYEYTTATGDKQYRHKVNLTTITGLVNRKYKDKLLNGNDNTCLPDSTEFCFE